MIGELTNHLWQSTFYAIATGMLALALRRNRAQVRYWLWLSASLKFFVPFSLLISLGSHLAWTPAPKATVTQAVSYTIVEVTQPFATQPSAGALTFAASAPHTTNWALIALFSVWACGFAVIALIRLKDWLGIRAAVRSSAPLDIPAAVAVRSSASLLEPGVVGLDVFGVSRPILLLPEGILDRLTPAQLQAVFAHELCHVRRRDNLAAAIHMVVEAVFWFHPFVWLIGGQLVKERERACDEDVLRLGNDPQVYAQGILNVCKFYVESPVRCVSGITGSDLKKRIQRIMKEHFGVALSARKKLLLAVAGAAVLAVPVVAGVVAKTGAHAGLAIAHAGLAIEHAEKPTENAEAPAAPDPQGTGRTDRAISGTVAGTVYDQNGFVVPNAFVSMSRLPRETGTTVNVKSDAAGNFKLTGLPVGDYELQVEALWFQTYSQSVTLKTGRDMFLNPKLTVGGFEEPLDEFSQKDLDEGCPFCVSFHWLGPADYSATVLPYTLPTENPAANLQAAGDLLFGTVHVSSVTIPRILKVDPVIYPQLAKAAGVGGAVILSLVIAKDGTVSSVKVASTQADPLLAQAAAEAIRQWLFSPLSLDGEPTETEVTLAVFFSPDRT